MDDYMIQALDIFSEGASRAARSERSLIAPRNDSMLTELQSSVIIMQSFDDSLKAFSDGLHRIRSAKARYHNTLLPISRLPNDLLVEVFGLASGMKDHPTGSCYRRRVDIYMLATLVFVWHADMRIRRRRCSVISGWTLIDKCFSRGSSTVNASSGVRPGCNSGGR
ncbi:hypothetical protein FRB95_004951 [Tulasnella sp. JGI-2019a]|nr:hypothetical protein FRB95_004951 [Tulasnella sp. JGI-2019a]